jgi:hypothetical protein
MPRCRWRYGALVAALAATVLAVTAGCGAPSGLSEGASAAATEFARALRQGDGEAACAVLAPRTREELEQSERTPCDRAVTQEQLPDGDTVRTVDVYGDQARVVLTGDTVFLSHFSSGWKVTAAGCRPRPEQPYDCMVEGG